MKRFFVLILGLSFHFVTAQSVDRNDIVITASPGVSLYYFSLIDSTSTVQSSADEFGFRAPVSVEYVFNRSIGISGDFVYSRFLNSAYAENSVLDFGLSLRFHSPSSQRIVHWFGAVGCHYSKFHLLNMSPIFTEEYNAKGFSLFYEVGANVYLNTNQNFGIGLSLNGDGYKYNKATFRTDTGGTFDFKMNALCMAAGINLFYKI